MIIAALLQLILFIKQCFLIADYFGAGKFHGIIFSLGEKQLGT